MKLVGRERDYQISELKGYKPGYGNLAGIRRHCHFKPSSGSDPLPRWSTNRNDAWELWDELKRNLNKVNYTYYKHQTLEEITILIVPGKKSLTFYGKDFADCVSQAWIAWKESK